MPPKLVALLILLGLTLSSLAPGDNLWPGRVNAQNAKSWVYLNAFQSQKLIAIDPVTGRVESTIEVDDLAGTLGAAVTSDGKTVLTVDGGSKSRLRMFNAATRELIAEHAFDHRVLELGIGPVVHLTADDRRLLVKTYDYAAAAKGIRVFDVQNRRFLPVGLQERGCDDPSFASARDGSLVAVCRGFLTELEPFRLNGLGEWIIKNVPTSIEIVADVALSSDGDILYILGEIDASGHFGVTDPWLLSRWTRGQPEASVHDVRAVLGFQGAVTDPRGRAISAMSTSPDGKALAIVAGPHVWLLDSASLRVVGHWRESSSIDRPAFTPDGKEILAMRHLGSGRSELIRISTVTRNITRVPLDHLGMNFIAGAATFIVAPAP